MRLFVAALLFLLLCLRAHVRLQLLHGLLMLRLGAAAGAPQFLFHQCPNLKEVVIPATITKIAEDTFSECPADLTLKVASGSYAEQYAQEQGINYESV